MSRGSRSTRPSSLSRAVLTSSLNAGTVLQGVRSTGVQYTCVQYKGGLRGRGGTHMRGVGSLLAWEVLRHPPQGPPHTPLPATTTLCQATELPA